MAHTVKQRARRPDMNNHRDRKLLDLAHELHECTHCGSYGLDGLEPAHQNGIEAGKGQSIKGQDHRHAALCHRCHALYDSGPASRAEKLEMWTRAHLRTFDEYWKRGWLKVTR